MRRFRLVFFILLISVSLLQAARKPRVVALSAAKRVPYSKAGDPAGAQAGERDLLVRALTVDGQRKEWVTGETHDVTDRSFVVRRALKVNDALPGERGSGARSASGGWVWQRGPWLLVDRETARITALKLPDYDPGVSQAVWFRDYAAYCGLAANSKSLYAVVMQAGGRRPSLIKRLAPYDAAASPQPACALAVWRRAPMGVTFYPAGREPVSFELAPGSAVLVEENGEEEPPAGAAAK